MYELEEVRNKYDSDKCFRDFVNFLEGCNKIRDICIFCTVIKGATLKEAGKEYGLSSSRIEDIVDRKYRDILLECNRGISPDNSLLSLGLSNTIVNGLRREGYTTVEKLVNDISSGNMPKLLGRDSKCREDLLSHPLIKEYFVPKNNLKFYVLKNTDGLYYTELKDWDADVFNAKMFKSMNLARTVKENLEDLGNNVVILPGSLYLGI